MISSLTISLGLFYLLMAAIAWWVLRSATVHLAVKIIVPCLLLVLTIATYLTLPGAFGYPVGTTFSTLPQQAELIAFHPYDDEKMVDLWLLQEGAREPRAYSVPMTDDLKETLRKAKKAKADGGRTMLAKAPKAAGKKRPAYMDIDGGESSYVLLPNAFQLPKKD